MKLKSQKKYNFTIFTDTHLPVENKEAEFTEFLNIIEKVSNISENIIFLGDIFEVWSGVSYYNHARGKELIRKIKKLQSCCKFTLIEGNWDFFLCKNFGKSFNICTDKHLSFNIDEKTLTFTHGHYFGDWQTRVLNFILTNPISYLAWKTECLKKLEVKVAKKFLNKETNPLPNNYNLELAAKKLRNSFKQSDFIFCGHFHKEEIIDNVFFLKDYSSSKQFYGITLNTMETLAFQHNEITMLNSKKLK